jgi:hypothetical protein
MRRGRSCRRGCAALIAGWLLAAGAPLDAASFMLMPGDRDEAIRAGRRSVANDDWGGEWRVNGGRDQQLTVMTPFHRLALAARNSAFQDKELNPREIESLLKTQQGKVSFWATLRGDRADFARFYVPRLMSRQREIKASFVQNERTALRGADGQYTARCLYVFPADGLDPRGTVTLLVRDGEEKAVATFTVDLASMR